MPRRISKCLKEILVANAPDHADTDVANLNIAAAHFILLAVNDHFMGNDLTADVLFWDRQDRYCLIKGDKSRFGFNDTRIHKDDQARLKLAMAEYEGQCIHSNRKEMYKIFLACGVQQAMLNNQLIIPASAQNCEDLLAALHEQTAKISAKL